MLGYEYTIRAIQSLMGGIMEKAEKKFMIASLTTVGVILALIVGSMFFSKRDNVLEEAAEELIKEKTGIEIDLSPGSPEK